MWMYCLRCPSMLRCSDSGNPLQSAYAVLLSGFRGHCLDRITILSFSISSSSLSTGSGRFLQSCRCQGDPLLFIWTFDCRRCSVIGLLLVVKKLLMVGLACSDQSGTDSCLLEEGCMCKTPPPYFLTRVKITQETLVFYRIMYKSMRFCAVNSFQTTKADFITFIHALLTPFVWVLVGFSLVVCWIIFCLRMRLISGKKPGKHVCFCSLCS